jgi:hypothetical protein
MRRVAALGTVVGLTPVLKLTVPLPSSAAPAVTTIHPALLVAVHAQPVGAVTVAEPFPPAAPMDCDNGATA